MRHSILMILAVMAALILSACAGTVRNTATVKVGMDPQGHLAYADSMFGQVSLDDWIDTSVRQEQGTVAIALWEKARIASKQGDLKKAQEYINLAQEVSNNNTYTKARLINASDYRASIIDGPFAGQTLAPGGSSSEEKVPVGTISFRAIATTSNGRDMTVTIVRSVMAGQKKSC